MNQLLPVEVVDQIVREERHFATAPEAFFQVHRAFPGKAALIFRKKYSESRNP